MSIIAPSGSLFEEPIRQNEAEHIVCAWFHYVSRIGDEKEALNSLVPQNRVAVIESIKMIRDQLLDNQPYFSSPLGAPVGKRAQNLIKVMGGDKFAPQEITRNRVEKSYKSIVEGEPSLKEHIKGIVEKTKQALVSIPFDSIPEVFKVQAGKNPLDSIQINPEVLKDIENFHFLKNKGAILASALNEARDPQAVDAVVYEYFNARGDTETYQNFKSLLLDIHEEIEAIKEEVKENEEDQQKAEEKLINLLADQLAEPFFGQAKFAEEKEAQTEAIRQILYYRLALTR